MVCGSVAWNSEKIGEAIIRQERGLSESARSGDVLEAVLNCWRFEGITEEAIARPLCGRSADSNSEPEEDKNIVQSVEVARREFTKLGSTGSRQGVEDALTLILGTLLQRTIHQDAERFPKIYGEATPGISWELQNIFLKTENEKRRVLRLRRRL